jgi:hypothetical protein
MRGRKASAPATASMTITAEGAPAAASAASPAGQTTDDTKMDPMAAATAHGAKLPAPPPVPAMVVAAPTSSTAPLAPGDTPAALAERDESPAMARKSASGPYGQQQYGASGGGASNAAAPAGAPYATQSPYGGYAKTPAAPPPAAHQADLPADATRAFDALAAAGDQGAALWAARSVRDGNGGCVPAVPRFDQVAQAAFGTNVGYDATLEGGRCLSALGSIDNARSHFARLLTVPDYASRAQAEINGMSQGQVAQRAEASKPKAAAPPPPAARAAPAKPVQQQKSSQSF